MSNKSTVGGFLCVLFKEQRHCCAWGPNFGHSFIPATAFALNILYGSGQKGLLWSHWKTFLGWPRKPLIYWTSCARHDRYVLRWRKHRLHRRRKNCDFDRGDCYLQYRSKKPSRLSINRDRIIWVAYYPGRPPPPKKGSADFGRWNVWEDRILLNPSYCIGLAQPTLSPARLQLDCSENVDEEAVEHWINKDSTLECCEVLSDDDIVSVVQKKQGISKNVLKVTRKIL
ncbi:hypothetical protein AVEN_97765-1 [Araneus ventricosus]|uniref:Uncharacterized protein n=1 Tax=Araneus ventricosus TaxID=182803 RepID=A0A4Y2V2N0_ARAVE|nr:hypothetical protein AVEN_97765-1 [Araneus ventricosus]